MKFILKNLLLGTMVLASASFAKTAQSAASPSVESAIKNWEQAVESAKIDAIMKLYDKDAIMISTFAQAPLTKRKQIEEFYKKITANPDIKVDILESHPRQFEGMATNSGRYALSFTQEGEEVTIPARFTFVYELKNDQWMIVEQHSSRMPEGKEKVE